jgi:aspartyl-tRNA(Asn)/glutamyl-tRNA(Gln) amidotransferase subunit B
MNGEGRITGKLAKQCMDIIAAENREPEEIVQANNWEQLSDPAKIAGFAAAVFAAEEKTVAELRALAGSGAIASNGDLAGDSGKEKRRRTLVAYLVGKTIAATGGRADPKIAGEQVEKLL